MSSFVQLFDNLTKAGSRIADPETCLNYLGNAGRYLAYVASALRLAKANGILVGERQLFSCLVACRINKIAAEKSNIRFSYAFCSIHIRPVELLSDVLGAL